MATLGERSVSRPSFVVRVSRAATAVFGLCQYAPGPGADPGSGSRYRLDSPNEFMKSEGQLATSPCRRPSASEGSARSGIAGATSGEVAPGGTTICQNVAA